MCVLPYLVAKGYKVKVMSDDDRVLWMAENLGLEIVTLDSMGEFDIFLCVHGNRIIPEKYLSNGVWVNVHPCLGLYNGTNPIKRYLANGDEEGWVASHHMTKDVDEGEVIYEVGFYTGKCNSYADFYNEALRFYFLTIDRTLEQV